MMVAAPRFEVAPHRRGVWKVRGKVLGRNAYYARTSEGEILGDRIWIASEFETDAELVRRLRRELNAVEPARARLQLVARTVMPAIDGPSPSHPEMTDVALELRAAIEKAHASLQADPNIDHGEFTRAVFDRLSRALERPA